MFSIKTDRPKAFNIYLIGKIKADLNKSAFFFLPIFIFRGKKYSVKGCINSIYLEKDKADDPLEKQETAYSYYAENAEKINSKIESELRYASEMEDDIPLSSRFEPACFIIFPDSSCGISFRDNEIDDEYNDAAYLVVSIRPRIIFKGCEHDYFG